MEENQSEPEYKPFDGKNLNRVLAILFVVSAYFVIFLKIVFLK